MRQVSGEEILINGATTNGGSRPFYAGDYRHLEITIVATGGTVGGTVKLKGTNQDVFAFTPTYWSAQDNARRWDFIQMKDLNDASTVNGDTGVPLTVADVRQFEVNTNGMAYVYPEISGYTNGTIYVYARGYNAS